MTSETATTKWQQSSLPNRAHLQNKVIYANLCVASQTEFARLENGRNFAKIFQDFFKTKKKKNGKSIFCEV